MCNLRAGVESDVVWVRFAASLSANLSGAIALNLEMRGLLGATLYFSRLEMSHLGI